jgi:hypothetical protein
MYDTQGWCGVTGSTGGPNCAVEGVKVWENHIAEALQVPLQAVNYYDRPSALQHIAYL